MVKLHDNPPLGYFRLDQIGDGVHPVATYGITHENPLDDLVTLNMLCGKELPVAAYVKSDFGGILLTAVVVNFDDAIRTLNPGNHGDIYLRERKSEVIREISEHASAYDDVEPVIYFDRQQGTIVGILKQLGDYRK